MPYNWSRRLSLTLFSFALPLASVLDRARAAEAWDNGAPFMLGGESCADYLSTVANDRSSQQLYDAWLSGYIEIAGEQLDGATTQLNDAEMDRARAWVHDYCARRGADTFLTAAVRLLTARVRNGSGA
jgi:hypothetical protein